MIDKIIKAVKSGNKKRGRNITIGAVIGFLLSCTAVMGEDNYLWIRENSGEFEFNTQKTTDNDGIGGNWNKIHPYSDENIWDADAKTYINNMILSSSKDNGNNKMSYGLRLSGDLNDLKFRNNGVITGTGSTGNNYGIYNAGSITTLANSGLIRGTSYGIYNNGGQITNLVNSGAIEGIGNYQGSIITLANSGLITGTRDYGISNVGSSSITTLVNSGAIIGKETGIHNSDGKTTNLVNSGLIRGTSYGIYNNGGQIKNLVNSGLIGNTSYGIFSNSNSSRIEALINTGVIFGTTNVIKSKGTNSANNYGILATKGSSAIDGTITAEKYYGLEIEQASGIVSNGSDYDSLGGRPTDIVVGYDDSGNEIKRNMTIKNAGIQGGSGRGISTDSFAFSGTSNEFNNSVLNGKSDTLKVSGTDREVKGSIINAYGTAVVFGGADKKLTLSGTVVNGGVDETNKIAVSGSGGGDTLILQSGEVGYVDGSTGTQNTIINGNVDMGDEADIITVDTGAIINGNVDMGDGDDVLNIANGGKINGTLDGGVDNDTLNFGESGTAKTRAASSSDEIRIMHNISGFENINVNSNVTFYEKTVKDDGTLGDLAITGAGNITIGANGVLTLRIDSANGNKHALSTGNNGTIKSENGGKLLLALNGARNTSTISFGDLALDGSLATGSKGNFDTTSKFHTIESLEGINEVKVVVRWSIPEIFKYKQLNKIYHGILSVDELGNFNVDNDEKLSIFLGYLNDIYAGNPYSYSSELSRKSTGMFREIVTENQFKANTGKWMIYGGLTHVDGGTKDTYYGKGYYTYDIGSSDMDADTKITGAYILGEYGVSDTFTSGVVIGGNKLKSDLSNDSKIDGSALYLGTYAKKYIGNLKVIAGAGFQYGDYDADRLAVNRVASSIAEPVMKYSDNYNDMTYDIYLNGRYSNPIGDNLFLEPYGTLSYIYTKQDGVDEGNKTLAIETDSKSFDYTVGKVGIDLKKNISHSTGKSTLSAGVSYTRILNGADEEYITGRFKGGSDFDILVAHKNEHSIGLNAKYTLELENGILFDVKGSYAVERDSHNGAGKNKTKGEWIVGAGLGYKF